MDDYNHMVDAGGAHNSHKELDDFFFSIERANQGCNGYSTCFQTGSLDPFTIRCMLHINNLKLDESISSCRQVQLVRNVKVLRGEGWQLG